jgi:hypothetical protein
MNRELQSRFKIEPEFSLVHCQSINPIECPYPYFGKQIGIGGFSRVYELVGCPYICLKVADVWAKRTYSTADSLETSNKFITSLNREVEKIANALKDPKTMEKNFTEVFSAIWMVISSGEIAGFLTWK